MELIDRIKFICQIYLDSYEHHQEWKKKSKVKDDPGDSYHLGQKNMANHILSTLKEYE